ncbi:LuxR C-terminal-related transcriptional regulator [Parerythrobacter jejuensis]|uniref:Response regulator n=1 Tax=Parerythrobacter jejuensis TaxID=795812 RepID=A0A845AMG6_9SPHN|nr:response regulator transcription factor [Parerythrobacter jejuensis]MXP31982.1 response regulator [Parerythrobacter jejuensis]
MTFGRRFSAVVADDHAIIRQALTSALGESDELEGLEIMICEEVENGIEAIGAIRKHRPDLLMLDVSMPHAGGTEVLLEARRWSPETKVVVFTGIAASGKIAEIVDAGADGVFCKSDDLAELTRAIPRILQGARIICARYLAELEKVADRSPLTDRERQVLNLVVAGRTNREIAETLGISAKTVDRHRTNMMAKTGVHSGTELVAFALREGLIDPMGSQA